MKKYDKKTIKLVKSMLEYREYLENNMDDCKCSVDVLESLNSSIFYLSMTVCSPECCSADDMKAWILNQK